MPEKKIQILIGIDEDYTQHKIVDCFRHRSEYQVTILDKSDQVQSKLLEKLNYDFFWLEYEELDFEKLATRSCTKLMNTYCIRKGLIRKCQLAYYLKKYMTKRSTQMTKYLPETWIFELDYLDYIEEALNEVFEVELSMRDNLDRTALNKPTKKFILKSSMTNKGNDILIFDLRQQLVDFFQNRIDQSEDETIDLREWVIQEYIDNPLQLNAYKKRKFHLRVYVLAVGDLKVYVYEDILALFCLDTYTSGSNGLLPDSNEMKSHITNTCYQLDNLTAGEDVKKAEDECIKKFWELNLDTTCVVENKRRKDLIFGQVKDCVGELFKCFENEPTVFQPLANAFELYGLDFLVDENLGVKFLEVNAFPDFKQTGDTLNDLVCCLFYQSVALVCDNYFDISPVCDTTKMHLVFERK